MEKSIVRNGYMQLVFLFLFNITLYAQSPYSIAPKWFFGKQGGISFPTVGAPTPLLGGKVDGLAQEASSTMCDQTGNVLFYTDSYRLYDGNNNFVQFINGGTSSTNSSVCFPDPSDPANLFYLVTANEDFGGGGSHGASTATSGIFWYRIQKTGPGTISVISGPTQLAANNEVSEQLCSGSDGNGGYWVVAHQGGGAGNGNQLWSWRFTSTGVGTKQISSVAGTDAATVWQGSLKINKCQTRLAAAFWSGKVEVYNWNSATGMVTGLFRSYTLPSAFVYGCEFSPDGNMLYFTSLVGNQLYQFDLTANVVIPLGSGSSNNITEMGTLQLGPDDKIYVTNVSNYAQPAYIGVVNNPNVSGIGCTYSSTGFILNNSVGNWPNIYRGIANEAWINPMHTIDTTGNCKTIGFSYDFMTYFLQTISIVANSQEWDFGDGGGFQTGLGASPSHTYSTGGSYTIQMRVTDATCNKVWSVSRTITVNSCTTCTDAVPPTSVTPINPICANDAGNIILTANGGSGSQLEWHSGSCAGPIIGTGNNLSIASPSVATSYFVRWLSGSTCVNSTCISVNVTTIAVPIPSIVGILSSCANTNGIAFSTTDNSGVGNTYIWSSAGGVTISSSNNSPSITSSINSNSGSVMVTEIAGTCSTTVSQNISIVPSTSLAYAGSDRNVCVNSFTLNANNPTSGNGVWTVANGTGNFSPTANDPKAIVSGLSNGLNEFIWTVNGSCGINDDTVTITLGTNGLNGNAYTSSDTACFGSPKNIQVVTSGTGSGNYTYEWTSSDNSFTLLTTSAVITVSPENNSTIYYLTIIDTENSGCNAADTVIVYALADQELIIPNLITPNGDERNDFLEIKDTNELKMLPGASLEIMNRWGDRVYGNSNYNNTWNAPNLSDGVYYYYLKSGCGSRVYKGWLQVIH